MRSNEQGATSQGEIVVAKIGGSTLGSHDTTLADVVELKRRGIRPVVVHGGGSLISEWLARHNVETRFERGLRVTDEESLRVVVAVLAGLLNKQIVASLMALGENAIGLSGADGGLLRARVLDPKLGFVGEIKGVQTAALTSRLDEGAIPVIAPIAVQWDGERPTGQLLNVNADAAAGGIAAAMGARWLVFLTDVGGVQSTQGDVLSHLVPDDAESLMGSGVIEGGMIPKVQACLAAARAGCQSVILDGREEHALMQAIYGQVAGTVVG
ncbi:MAG: acetylglutamate kinase [Burkholderiales bacterium]|jgi:acetylglutamate kinase